MLFNSYGFLLIFLPATLGGFFLAGRLGRNLAAAWMLLASLTFYSQWDASYLPLLLGSIAFNFAVGTTIASARRQDRPERAKLFLGIGLAGDLAALGYFKYADFLVGNLNAAIGTHWQVGEITLPMGISFFTFTQVAFLVDAFRGKASEYNIAHYGLFVTYFPHLVAGPILHHKEMMPQFGRSRTYSFSWTNMAVGFSCFAIGLAKKVLVADSLSPYANSVFDAAQAGDAPSLFYAWGGALAYTFQIYFDFSGYSDMAIGLSRLFGVRLPLNFNSPYKAADIIDFWRRWHMTLSRFLRDYVYISLGGNRHGTLRRWGNLMATMLLGGLWHGAAWTFVLWGGLHGLFLVVNHAWRVLWPVPDGARRRRWARTAAGRAITFLCVVAAWVPFRATSLDAARHVLSGLAGLNGAALPMIFSYRLARLAPMLQHLGITFASTSGTQFVGMYSSMLAAAALAFFCPNSQEILARYRPALEPAVRIGGRAGWRMSPRWAIASGLLLAAGFLSLLRPTQFLYFQF